MKNSSTSSSRDARCFLIRGVFFILIGGMILYAFVSISAAVSPEPLSRLGSEVEEILSHAVEVEILGVGHSHNQAIDFAWITNAFPAWANGTDFFQIEYALHALLPKLPNLHTVLVPIAYFGFCWDNSIRDPASPRDYYATLRRLPLIRSDIPLYLRSQAPNIPKDHGKGVVLAALRFVGMAANPETKVVPMMPLRVAEYDIAAEAVETFSSAVGGMPRLDLRTKTREMLLSEALSMYTEEIGVPFHLAAQQLTLKTRPNIVQEATICLEHIIQFLEERDVRLVFYTPPYFFRYTELYDRDTLTEMYAIMANQYCLIEG